MTLSQIEIFVELCSEKNFSKTAAKLGITQSAVSHAIKKLEQGLGVNLVSRERKKFRITKAGTNLLVYCQEIKQQIQNIEVEVAAQKNGTLGTIRIGTLWSVANSILSKLLNAYKRKFPAIDVIILEGTDQEIEKWLLSRAVDVGIFSCYNKKLELTKLMEDRFYVAVPEKSPLASARMLAVGQLTKFPFIMSKGGCEPLIESIAQLHQAELNVKFEAREVLTIVTMVKENLGISLIPELAIPKDILGIKYIPLDTDYRRSIYLGRLKESRLRKTLDDFVEYSLSISFDRFQIFSDSRPGQALSSIQQLNTLWNVGDGRIQICTSQNYLFYTGFF